MTEPVQTAAPTEPIPTEPAQTEPAQTAGPTEPKPKAKRARQSQKRAPARPHKRLPTETLDTRIAKLQKRLDHARAQIEDAARHLENYQTERRLRDEAPRGE
jgi:hypothetical protein